MASTTLIAYATKHDSTHQVAELVADILRDDGLEVEVRPAGDVTTLEPYGAVVIGGALYMGRWHRDARHLLSRHRIALAQRPVFVYGMGPLEMVEDQIAGARKQLDHALAKVPEVQPVAVTIFGGVVHPEELHFPFNKMPAGDARDPEAIRAWAHDVAAAIRTRVPATAR
jgi:menaquinone-dependent protoporphyrinogen oxidase